MLSGKKKEKFFTCSNCGNSYSNLDAERVCSNCFACTGCEIYTCPACREEDVVKPKKPMSGIT
jgi:hypothetical protein